MSRDIYSAAERVLCERVFRPIAIVGVVVISTSCATLSGAPTAPFDQSKYTSTASPLSLTPDDLQLLIDATDEPTRNRLLRRILSDIDVRYLDFAGGVVSGKNRFEFGKNILTLSSSIASSLTDSAGVKSNYAALSALLSGGGAQVDSNFLFNQTSLALVSTMDAQRAIVLAEVRTSMAQSIQEYPGQTAFADAIRYFRAGTLASAARDLQKAAAAEAVKKETFVRNIAIPTDAQVAYSIQRGEDFTDFIDKPANVEALRKSLIAVGVHNIDAETSAEELRKAARSYFRANGPSGNAEDLFEALKKNGYKPK